MSCSARLPVYLLLIDTCFASFFPSRWQAIGKGLIMLGCYTLGILAAAVTAWLVRRSLLHRSARSTFIMEMPSYKLPQASEVLRQMWVNASKFLTKAGTIIFALSVLLWAAMYWPRLSPATSHAVETQTTAQSHADGLDQRQTRVRIENAMASRQLEGSIAGHFGHALSPALSPIGCDWKIGIGLVGAFAAREVFVSTLGIVYGVGNTESSGTVSLSHALTADRHPDGRPVWTPLVAATVLVWFVLAMQCMSTVAVVRRETGGWAWPLGMLVYMNSLAYGACLLTYQVGSRLISG